MPKGRQPRPWNTAIELAKHRCEKCANLICYPKPHCANGRILDPDNCPDYADSSRERERHFGTMHKRGNVA